MIKTTNEVQELILDKLARYFAITPEKATEEQMYKAVSLVVRGYIITEKTGKQRAHCRG